ncbi:MAG TPA: NUDIX hydrolase [Acidimicrobiales bacterium]
MEILEAGAVELAPSGDLDEARRQLRRADLVDPVAIAHREEILRFLDDHPDALHRSCAAGHLTGSALVVDAARRRTLLMLHRKLERWFQPGGHADGDANLAGVALKEAGEETGIEGLRIVVPAIDVDVHRVDPPGEPVHLHLDLRFLVLAPLGAVEQANEESLALRWVTVADLEGLGVDASTRRLVELGLG